MASEYCWTSTRHGWTERRTHPLNNEPPPEVLAKFRDFVASEERRRAEFGDVRPIITTIANNRRLVAVGATIYWNDEKLWRTFQDFLNDYLPMLFAREWGHAEEKKPLRDRHIIMQWYDAYRQLKLRSKNPDENGICSSEPDGPSYAYLLLAYDLYLLRDHGALRERFVRRLKQAGEFQGARYELFVAAVLIRAGFDVVPEDERDGRQEHPEYLATHRQTKERFAVEAKSRRIPGVLGFGGEAPNAAEELDIRQLVRRALGKKGITDPYIVFVDANMSPEYAERTPQEWMTNIDKAVGLADSQFNDVGMRVGSLYNLIVVTNVPDHYGEAGGPLPEPTFVPVFPRLARRPVRQAGVFGDLIRALGQSHRVPVDFPSTD